MKIEKEFINGNEEICLKCRYGPNSDYNAGGDCSNCKNGDYFKDFKQYDLEVCHKCLYDDDPCHCDCVECTNGNNFIPKPSLKEEIQNKIILKEKELFQLKNELNKINKLEDAK